MLCMKLDGHLMFFKFVFDFLPKFAGSELLKNLRKCNFLAFFFKMAVNAQGIEDERS